MDNSAVSNFKGSTGDRTSSVGLYRTVNGMTLINTPLPGQNHYLSGLTTNITEELRDERNEAMSSSLAARQISAAAIIESTHEIMKHIGFYTR